jgi:putative nucleotidyltransferase with HDIG domain
MNRAAKVGWPAERDSVFPPAVGSQHSSRARWVPIYTRAISFLGLGFVVFALSSLPADRPGLLFFACMAALAEFFSVELFVSSRGSRVSVSSAITVAAILVFGIQGGVLTCLVGGSVAAFNTRLRGASPGDGRASWLWRSAFNIGMFVAAAACAGFVYVAAGGLPGLVNRDPTLFALLAASTADEATNLFILIGILTLQTGRSPLQLWKQDFGWGVPIAIVGNVLGGGGLALAYQTLGTLGSAVFLLPILSAGYSLKLYLGNMRRYVSDLEDANKSLEKANFELLEGLSAVIDAYDVYTYGHSRQVAIYAGAIAEKAGLSSKEQTNVVRAGLIHDVGKVGVTENIIGKPAPLTDEEYQIIKRHPAIGAEIVGQMTTLQHLVSMVKYHHERWDGKGYPGGLAGEQIPLGARIIAVADSLEAMCSDRPYRATRSLAEAVAEVKRCSGTQFDPAIVEALVAVVDEKGPQFFQNSATSVDGAIRLTRAANVDTAARYLKKSSVT